MWEQPIQTWEQWIQMWEQWIQMWKQWIHDVLDRLHQRTWNLSPRVIIWASSGYALRHPYNYTRDKSHVLLHVVQHSSHLQVQKINSILIVHYQSKALVDAVL